MAPLLWLLSTFIRCVNIPSWITLKWKMDSCTSSQVTHHVDEDMRAEHTFDRRELDGRRIYYQIHIYTNQNKITTCRNMKRNVIKLLTTLSCSSALPYLEIC